MATKIKRDKKILVTGGAGFIGSHLCESLLKDRHRVICLDNFNNYYDPRIKEDNINGIKKEPSFYLIRGDILDKNLLEKIFLENDISKIVHLAALAGVRASFLAPEKYVDVDVKGTLNLLEMAEKYKIPHFIFASSSSVYGVGAKIPFGENEINLIPISPYSASKISAEIFCQTYSKIYNIPITVLRIFTAFGPRQRPEMAIHKFTRLISQGKSIPMFGKGNASRDYTYIDDIIAGFIAAIGKKFDFEIFNLGNSRTIKLKDLIKILSRKLRTAPKINQMPDQIGDVPITYADISKAKKLLGWAPRVSFEEGVEQFLQWYREKEKFLNSISYVA